ncbi:MULTISPECIES: transcriptional regulator [unclassified Novosphingobium]|uniref:3'-5' exonuclease n=1 Tax=unclassified Novosphingobium TaxID=2644732 RepID=UPI00146A3221|nr:MULTISPECIES: transcriptional regulator [unclassified Novosphingobium]NMN06732.1 hypothetical protein [Novosphingobium sp. SG919]NMN88817.1 hypothetical protein [Novosphingobium sp. SG916]
MLVFLDFEASSLAKLSYPIEVGWVFEDGASAQYLIRPAPAWTDWDERAATIHGIARDELAQGTPHAEVARVMVEQLTAHDLLASAPSWDGKWLSALLRAAGYPRHTLRLRDSDEARREVVERILAPRTPPEKLRQEVANLVALADVRAPDGRPAHRALANARVERDRWCAVRDAALARAAELDRGA